MTHRVLLFSCLFLFVLLPTLSPVGAQEGPPSEVPVVEWGFWSGGPGDSFSAPEAGVTLCVAAAGLVELRSLRSGVDHRFGPQTETPDCKGFPVDQAFVVHAAQGGISVAVLGPPPRILDRPGVAPLPEPGGSVLIQGMSPEGEVTLAPGGGGFAVDVLAWPSLDRLQVGQGGSEWTVQVPRGQDVLVVVADDGPQQALLRWSDPGWFALAPNIGQALAPVALALLVSLFRGGAGGEWIRPGRKKDRRDPEDPDPEDPEPEAAG